MLSAGWTTHTDRLFIIPILAWAHAELLEGPGVQALRTEGENSAAYVAVLMGDYQRQRYQTTLRQTGAAEIGGSAAAPTFARHFVSAVLALYLGIPTQERSALIRATVHLSALSLAAVEEAIVKSTDAEARAEIQGMPATTVSLQGDVDYAVLDQLLTHQLEFLTDLFAAMRLARMERSVERIQSRRSLENEAEPPIALYPGVGEIMCTQLDDIREIQFTVERYPCTAEVLDPRVVRIPAGKCNNRHKHAHETLFYFISGTGKILVGQTWVQVEPGDAVFCPRWAVHQTHNTGTEELVLLAITDYYLTNRIYVGKYEKI
jgi:mannose-6-phosphate isomerase-like protein (cupin superfamily)